MEIQFFLKIYKRIDDRRYLFVSDVRTAKASWRRKSESMTVLRAFSEADIGYGRVICEKTVMIVIRIGSRKQ